MGDVARMELVGGHPALDFVNTLGGRPDNPDDEYLFEYEDVLTWLVRVQLLAAGHADDLQRAARSRPAEADATYRQALRLRRAIDRILRSRWAGEVSAEQDREVVRAVYADAVGHATLKEDPASFGLTWVPPDPPALPYALWPLAGTVTDLLSSAPLQRLNRCDHCRWLFLDSSKNHSRRWCSMNACGAITKMRRYRAARRPAAAFEAEFVAPPGSDTSR